MFDGERQENGQTIIRHLLILHRTAHDDIVIAIAPVVGCALHETINALGEKEKPKVAPLLHHLPAFRPPFIRIFQKKIGGKAGKHQLATLYLPRLVALPPHGEVEVARLSAFAA